MSSQRPNWIIGHTDGRDAALARTAPADPVARTSPSDPLGRNVPIHPLSDPFRRHGPGDPPRTAPGGPGFAQPASSVPLVRTAPSGPPRYVDPRYRIMQPGSRLQTPESRGPELYSGSTGHRADANTAAPSTSAREHRDDQRARDIDAARFIGATIQLFEAEVLVVQVAPRVLGDRGEAPAVVAAFQARFRRTIVLVSQDCRGVPTYFGPAPIAEVLGKIPFDAFAWRRYRYRRPPPQMLPIPTDPLPSYTSDAAWSESEDEAPNSAPSVTIPGRKREAPPARRTLDMVAPAVLRVDPSPVGESSGRRTPTLGGVAPVGGERMLDHDRTVPRPRLVLDAATR